MEKWNYKLFALTCSSLLWKRIWPILYDSLSWFLWLSTGLWILNNRLKLDKLLWVHTAGKYWNKKEIVICKFEELKCFRVSHGICDTVTANAGKNSKIRCSFSQNMDEKCKHRTEGYSRKKIECFSLYNEVI